MPYINKYSIDNNLTLYLWQITETVEDLAAECKKLGYAIDVTLNIKNALHKCEKLTELIMLNRIFNRNITLEHSVNGAPFSNDIEGSISISHSKGTLAIAHSMQRNFGIDIEHVSPRVIKIRDKFLSPEEKLKIAEADIVAHTRAWTAKEALFKAIPEDRIDFINHLHLCYTDDSNYTAFETRTELARKFDIVHLTYSDYIIAVAKEINE